MVEPLLLYRNNSIFMTSVVNELQKVSVNYQFANRAEECEDKVCFVFNDSPGQNKAMEVLLGNKKATFSFCNLLDSIIVGPLYSKEGDGCLDCAIKQAERNGGINLLALSAGIRFPEYKVEKLNLKYVIDFLILIQKHKILLERYRNKFDVVNSRIEKIVRHKIIKNMYCTTCGNIIDDSAENSFIPDFHTKKLAPDTYRIKKNIPTEEIYNNYFDSVTGVFSHHYREYLSTFVPAYGVELKQSPNYSLSGFGRAYSTKMARSVSILEGIERYCGAFNHRTRTHIYASYNDVKKIAVDPRIMTLHSDQEYMNVYNICSKYTDNLCFYWKWTYSVKNRECVLIPEQMIYYAEGFYRNVAANNRFVYDSSNGFALGSTVDEAVFHGLLELIERDNFLCTWYNRIEVDEIDINTTNLHRLKEIIFLLEQRNIEIRFFNTTMELGIPTVWCIAINKDEDSVMSCYNAAAADINPEKAIETAAFEVITSFFIYENEIKKRVELQNRIHELEDNVEEIHEVQDNILFYASKKNLKYFDFQLRKRPRKSVQELFSKSDSYNHEYLGEDLNVLYSKILKNYSDIYITDTTPKAVKQYELYAVKVLVPGMLTVTFGEQYRRVNKMRLFKERERRNLSTQFDVSLAPHPFP